MKNLLRSSLVMASLSANLRGTESSDGSQGEEILEKADRYMDDLMHDDEDPYEGRGRRFDDEAPRGKAKVKASRHVPAPKRTAYRA